MEMDMGYLEFVIQIVKETLMVPLNFQYFGFCHLSDTHKCENKCVDPLSKMQKNVALFDVNFLGKNGENG